MVALGVRFFVVSVIIIVVVVISVSVMTAATIAGSSFVAGLAAMTGVRTWVIAIMFGMRRTGVVAIARFSVLFRVRTTMRLRMRTAVILVAARPSPRRAESRTAESRTAGAETAASHRGPETMRPIAGPRRTRMTLGARAAITTRVFAVLGQLVLQAFERVHDAFELLVNLVELPLQMLGRTAGATGAERLGTTAFRSVEIGTTSRAGTTFAFTTCPRRRAVETTARSRFGSTFILAARRSTESRAAFRASALLAKSRTGSVGPRRTSRPFLARLSKTLRHAQHASQYDGRTPTRPREKQLHLAILQTVNMN